MFVQTVYQSKSRMRITSDDVNYIKTHSIPQNKKTGITSYLYYDDWNYLHILEGHAAQVADVMKRISVNKRHHSVKVRLMTRGSQRSFEGCPLGCVSADDFELQRVLKNFGRKNMINVNILDVVKILKRTAGRKMRTMSILEKQSLSDVRALKISEPKCNLTEDMLGLRS